MYCNHCGQPMAAGPEYGQAWCPRCGWVAAAVPPGYPAGRPMHGPVCAPPHLFDRRIHMLAVAWLVYAAVIGIGGFFGLAFAHAALGGHMDPFWGWHTFGHHWGSHHVPFVFWPFVTGAFFFRVGLALLAGIGLMQRAAWGRPVAVIAGFLALIHIPFGTVLGIWTLITLLSARNAMGYRWMAR